jgi:hypothetical protein
LFQSVCIGAGNTEFITGYAARNPGPAVVPCITLLATAEEPYETQLYIIQDRWLRKFRVNSYERVNILHMIACNQFTCSF